MKYVYITFIIFVSIWCAVSTYMCNESLHQSTINEQRIEQQEIELQKIQYAFEHRQMLDTVILNVNNKVVSVNRIDTMIVKFTNK